MRILIIEDTAEITTMLKHCLETEYYAVDTTEDGKTGSFLARTNNYDLIILDYMIPQKNGKEVCEEIRASGKTTPIIIISATADTNNKIELLNAGADDYITKPFSLKELLARIKALLRRPQNIKNDILKIGHISLDKNKHQVMKDGKPIYLTRKEFMLLEYLMRNKGVALSRGRIMEHVWDINADPFSNTIESHILSLRKKIQTKNKNPLIKTIPGIGYKIDD